MRFIKRVRNTVIALVCVHVIVEYYYKAHYVVNIVISF